MAMPTLSIRHDETTLPADEEFLALVCADQDLVRAEFDAIIAAEWDSPPPGPPDHDDGNAERPRSWGQHCPTAVAVPRRARRLDAKRWRRQRSPPATPLTTDVRKAGDRPT
jgi:hypothetical protein